MVFFLHVKKDMATPVFGMEMLDGDWKKVRPVDMTPDDGKRIGPSIANQGRPVETEHLPTRIRLEGPERDLADAQYNLSSFIVSDKFKEILERLEPGVHQFNPLTLEWKDGSIAAKRWWLHVCHRIDSVDEKKTTFTKRGIWVTGGDSTKTFVFSRTKIGNRHIWADKFMSFNPYVSETFKLEMDAAGVTGLGYQPWPETE